MVPPLLSTELLREDGHEQDLGSVQGRAPTHTDRQLEWSHANQKQVKWDWKD